MNRGVGAILLLTVCAGAQTSEKPKLSEEYAKTSLKALICISNRSEDKALKEALTDAEVAASAPAEEASLQQLKFFSVLHSIRTQVFDATLDAAAASHPGTPVPEAYVNQAERKSGIAADRICIAAWKIALRDRDAAQPDSCTTEKLGK